MGDLCGLSADTSHAQCLLCRCVLWNRQALAHSARSVPHIAAFHRLVKAGRVWLTVCRPHPRSQVWPTMPVHWQDCLQTYFPQECWRWYSLCRRYTGWKPAQRLTQSMKMQEHVQGEKIVLKKSLVKENYQLTHPAALSDFITAVFNKKDTLLVSGTSPKETASGCPATYCYSAFYRAFLLSLSSEPQLSLAVPADVGSLWATQLQGFVYRQKIDAVQRPTSTLQSSRRPVSIH